MSYQRLSFKNDACKKRIFCKNDAMLYLFFLFFFIWILSIIVLVVLFSRSNLLILHVVASNVVFGPFMPLVKYYGNWRLEFALGLATEGIWVSLDCIQTPPLSGHLGAHILRFRNYKLNQHLSLNRATDFLYNFRMRNHLKGFHFLLNSQNILLG